MDEDRKPILLVEDDRAIREALAELLVHMGADVELAADGEAAWGLLAEEGLRPGLVLLDLFLPRLDGLALLGRLRADARFRSLSVVTMSAAVKEPPPGADGHLEKPFDLERLREVVLPHCRPSEAADASRERRSAPRFSPRIW
jgi:DNA-binding response OmpR family regulator